MPEQLPPAEPVDELEGQPPAGPLPFYRDPMYLLGAAAVVAGVVLWSSARRRPRGGGPIYLAKPCAGCGGGSGAAQRITPAEGQRFVDASTGATVAYHDGHVGPVVDEPPNVAPGAPVPGVTPPQPAEPVPAGATATSTQPDSAQTEWGTAGAQREAARSAGPDDDNPVGAAVDPQALVIAEPADRGLDHAQV